MKRISAIIAALIVLFITGIIGTFDLRMQGEGLKGIGKTLTMVYYLHEDYRNGRRVFMNNYTSFTEKITTSELFEMFKDPNLRNISVGFDEIQKDLNSLSSDPNLIIEFCNKAAAQTRKKSVNMYWTAQRAMDVHKRLRIQTDYLLKPVRIHRDHRICIKSDCDQEHHIAVKSYDPHKNRPLVYLSCQEVGKLYDTEEVLTDSIYGGEE